jgi:hypothetical protein
MVLLEEVTSSIHLFLLLGETVVVRLSELSFTGVVEELMIDRDC